jgi:probable rRNA maturation factor
MALIHFFTEDIAFKIPNHRIIRTWIVHIIKNEGFTLKEINYIFCSDEHLRSVNAQYLSHNFYTDIITFDNSDSKNEIEADIFVSIDRIAENSKKFKKEFKEEFCRVLVHGVLHLMGYSDKNPKSKREMRKKENACLSLLSVPRGT